MRLIPAEPLIIEISDDERAMLRQTRGGYTTKNDTPDHALFEAMADKGLVKDVMETGAGMSWKLTRDGLTAIKDQ